MQLSSRSISYALVLVLGITPLFAKSKEGSKQIDSGKYGIFVSGNRVGTETFNSGADVNSIRVVAGARSGF